MRGNVGQLIQTAFDTADESLAEEKPFRLCDFTAWRLSSLQGRRFMSPIGLKRKRNESLPGVRQFLDQWGDAFRDRALASDQFAGPFAAAQISHRETGKAGEAEDIKLARAVLLRLRESPAKHKPWSYQSSPNRQNGRR